MRWWTIAAVFLAMSLACGRGGGKRDRGEGGGGGRGGGAGDVTGPRSDKRGFATEMHLQSGGLDRSALVHVPDGKTKDQKLPLVVLFHGGQSGDDAEKMAARWDHLGNQGFVMAFPNGIATDERAWAGPEDKRDFNFVKDLIAYLDAEVGIDKDRVYAAGFSNGSGFTWMLECFEADKFAGFGHVQQAMAKAVIDNCKPNKQVPTIWFHGDADEKAIWEGNEKTVGVPKTMDFILNLHECDPAKTAVTDLPDLPGDKTSVTRTVYTACKDVKSIELFRIHGGSHHWPTQEKTREAEGKCSDIDASAEMIRFWRENAGL
ncbi:MAG: hypothetical protein ABMB14_04700 [Myxococcota bacterium]